MKSIEYLIGFITVIAMLIAANVCVDNDRPIAFIYCMIFILIASASVLFITDKRRKDG